MKDFYTFADLQNWPEAAADVDPPIRLGVFGDPVAHSLSPRMQNAALRDCGFAMQYAGFQIAPEELREALRLVSRLDFIGLNLTVPQKVAAAGCVDQVDDLAAKIGAINTVTCANDQLIGSNTDAPAFRSAIREAFSVDLRDLRVLVLGAGGGAGRAIAMQCALENCERLVLVNRTVDKVRDLASDLAPYFTGPRVLGPVARFEVVPWDDARLHFQLANTDLVVNATSVGLRRSDPPVMAGSLLAPHLMIFEAIYSPASSLGGAAAGAGARYANGLSMLLHQGALSFERWFDREAPIEAMRRALEPSVHTE